MKDPPMVICWASITEDSAARAFAHGFYDAVGTYLKDEEQVDLYLAFYRGLERFWQQQFKLGNPEVFLHPPAHPHVCRRGQYDKTCWGCNPPVHGSVVLFRKKPPGEAFKGASGARGAGEAAEVQRLRMGRRDDVLGIDGSKRHGWIPVTLEAVQDGSFLSHLDVIEPRGSARDEDNTRDADGVCNADSCQDVAPAASAP
mmetsp:Transcript_4345/g.9405  ORF Transcript_4345/g.9405 Transcript_4345/m.9405 type:complete len:200 (+) Transcript_4345:2163-2762(+)